jgi:hypothetical protein
MNKHLEILNILRGNNNEFDKYKRIMDTLGLRTSFNVDFITKRDGCIRSRNFRTIIQFENYIKQLEKHKSLLRNYKVVYRTNLDKINMW